MIHNSQMLSSVDETEIDVFLKFSCFLSNPAHAGNLISSSSSFSKPTSRPLPQNALSYAACILSFPVFFHACKLTRVRLFSTSCSTATRLLRPWNFPGKNPLGGCHFLLQRIFPTRGSNPCLLHWGVGSLPLNHLGSPYSFIEKKNFWSFGTVTSGWPRLHSSGFWQHFQCFFWGKGDFSEENSKQS